ncbi:MAG: NADH:flavin oxidoreductase, partial [Desulfitobacteriaceae bacterium]
MRNRIVYPAITTCLAEVDGSVSSRMLDFYSQRASGGVGLIIVEPGVVHPQVRLAALSGAAWDDTYITGLRQLAQRIKSQGARAFIQLCHAGPKAFSRINGIQSVSASELPYFYKEPVRALSVSEISQITGDFVAAARRAREAGFDGIELHAAHFYLLSAFLSPQLNIRQDGYGQDTMGRTKIVREIVRAIKQSVGADFPVICRYHGFEDGDLGIKSEEAVKIAKLLADAGADALHISAYGLPQPQLSSFVTVPSTPIPTCE